MDNIIILEDIKFDGKPTNITEMKLEHVDEILETVVNLYDGNKGVGIFDVRDIVIKSLVPKCSNLTEKRFMSLTFSQLESLEEAFRKINLPFFRFLKRSRIDQWIKAQWSSLMNMATDASLIEAELPAALQAVKEKMEEREREEIEQEEQKATEEPSQTN